MTNRKLIKAIPGIIVGLGMTTLIFWGVTNDKKCDRMLRSGDATIQVAYVHESTKKISGGKFKIVTEFKTNDGIYSFRTTGLKDPAPRGLPIYVRFMPNCSGCYEFLWDSIAASDLYKVKYTRQGFNRREYELLK